MIKDKTFAPVCKESVENDHSYIVGPSSSLESYIFYYKISKFKLKQITYLVCSLKIVQSIQGKNKTLVVN